MAWLVGVPGGPALAAARRAAQAGYRDFKVKLGRSGDLEMEIAGVRDLRRALGAGSRLRLDVNGGWSELEAMAACRRLEPFDVEFLEEPCSSWAGAADRSDDQRGGFRTRIPLALDESLSTVDPRDLEPLVRRTGVRVLILKPMLLGGLTHCLDLGRRAASLNIDVVVSHCFDGPIALAAAGALALALPGCRAQGLAPHAGLDAWRKVPLPIHDATLRSWQTPGLGLAGAQLG